MLRFAQHDNTLPILVVKNHYRAGVEGWTRAMNVASTPERKPMGRHSPHVSGGERLLPGGET